MFPREDFVGPARAELKMLRENKANRRNLFQHIEFDGIECTDKGSKPCVLVRFSLPQGHRTEKMKKRKERKDYWDTLGRNLLPNDAIPSLSTARR